MTTEKLKNMVDISNRKDKVKDGIGKIFSWGCENPDEALATLVAISGVVWKGHKILKDHNEAERKKRQFYDRRRGCWSEARRNPTPYERDVIDTRYKNGESYNHILRTMNLL